MNTERYSADFRYGVIIALQSSEIAITKLVITIIN